MVCSVLLYDTGIRSKIAILCLSISEPPQYGFRRILVETNEFSTQTQNLQITHSKALSTWFESFFNKQKQFSSRSQKWDFWPEIVLTLAFNEKISLKKDPKPPLQVSDNFWVMKSLNLVQKRCKSLYPCKILRLIEWWHSH